MQYHALSLAEHGEGTRVALVGYRGERCIPAVEAHPRIAVHYVDPLAGKALRERSFLLFATVKIVALVLQLLRLLLWRLPRPELILVQNPPSIPTLAVAWLAARLRGAALVVDWHNLGFSILSHSRGSDRHPLVRVARMYERLLGRWGGDRHFCVTDAMRLWLQEHFGVDAHVLHDRPPRFFGPTSIEARHALFHRLKPQLDAWGVEALYSEATGVQAAPGETLFTVTDPRTGKPTPRPQAERPVLVMSSTSWTEDEDFGLLLDALARVDRRWGGEEAEEETEKGSESTTPRGRRRRSLRSGSDRSKGGKPAAAGPFLVVAVTGKGPLKAHYEGRIRALRLKRVAVCTLWLEAADYPLLVGSADLGVCLHESTSGMDLPMKVLDMFGCSLPVCALGFPCLGELVRDQENGLVFGDGPELARALEALLGGFPQGETALLGRLRKGVEGMTRWEENWEAHAAPVLCDDPALALRWLRGWWWGLFGVVVLVLGCGLVGAVQSP